MISMRWHGVCRKKKRKREKKFTSDFSEHDDGFNKSI